MSSSKTQIIAVTTSLILVAVGVARTQGEMIYHSAFQSIAGTGTQLEAMETSSEEISFFSEDLLNTGYVRDEQNRIVGNVSSFASLMSSLNGTHIRGLGRGSGFGTGEHTGTGTTEMRVEFESTGRMSFAMSGQLRLVPHTSGLNESEAHVRLTGPEGVVFEIKLGPDHPPDNLGIVNFLGSDEIQGELVPGMYQLEAVGVGRGSHGLTRCVDFDFTFREVEGAPIPEPSAYVLMLSCALIALRFRRHRRIGI